MSFTTVLLDGLAQYLENADVGTFHSSGVAYSTSPTARPGIFIDGVPATPDRVIVLTVYGEVDDPTQATTEVQVQARVRGTKDPRTAYETADAIFEAFQNLPRSAIGGTTVAGIFRISSAYIGIDTNGRHERASNFRILVHRPTLYRV